MKISMIQAQKVLNGNQSFMQFGFAMMITRLKTQYAKNPTQSTLQACTDEINGFLEKFASIMGADYETITKM